MQQKQNTVGSGTTSSNVQLPLVRSLVAGLICGALGCIVCALFVRLGARFDSGLITSIGYAFQKTSLVTVCGLAFGLCGVVGFAVTLLRGRTSQR